MVELSMTREQENGIQCLVTSMNADEVIVGIVFQHTTRIEPSLILATCYGKNLNSVDSCNHWMSRLEILDFTV